MLERKVDAREALTLANNDDTHALVVRAAQLRDAGHSNVVTFSKKVFLPLTRLCRDVCHYCTFAQTPKRSASPYLTIEQLVDVARRGAALGCKEALFTLGDKPERRYRVAREALEAMGYASTLEYLRDAAQAVFEQTGLLPHLNPGTMTDEDFALLRPVAPSMGLMLESISARLREPGMAHHGSPDKDPALRLETIARAGEARVPFTSGILIGIGETRRERIEALLALRDLHDRYGHLQEVIIQPFRAKAHTKMAGAPEPTVDDLVWTIAVARIVFGAHMNIQAPPNLSPGELVRLIGAGINDWGGVSPLTPDFVNPEAPWPHLDDLIRTTAKASKHLTERLTIYPAYVQDAVQWVDAGLQATLRQRVDADGLARTDDWSPGLGTAPPVLAPLRRGAPSHDLAEVLEKATDGGELSQHEIVRLLQARGDDAAAVVSSADDLRRAVNGDRVSYVVNRNINYTNLCYFHCGFCAFSKGKVAEGLRAPAYDLSLEEIARRVREAWHRGATEVCMQGGIHPHYTGDTYLEILHTAKDAAPAMHVHAFSPLEVSQGATTLGLPLADYLRRLRDAGLDTLPGTAAEVLDDEVRRVICPDKVSTSEWLQVMETAHEVGLRSTATLMYGHVERPVHLARHLLRVRELQARTGGFTEFVPLPFVHMEAPMYRRGQARKGPTWREAVLMHAVARLALHPHLTNIQTSWVKMGGEGAVACLHSGANDLGGTLMNESISRAAGASYGQEMGPARMDALIRGAGRRPVQRSTLYGEVPETRRRAGREADALEAVVNTPLRRRSREPSAVS